VSAPSLSVDQVIARIERMRDTCKTDESIANEHDRPDDAVWARDNVETLDACLILLRQQQERPQNEEKAIALRSCAEDQPASPASTEALPKENREAKVPCSRCGWLW
jgi:hypothetical protein